jgi:hypothetical protein
LLAPGPQGIVGLKSGRLKRRLKITGVSLLAVLLACYAALYFLVGSTYVRARVESELSRRTGYEIKIGRLRLAPPLGLVLSDIAVAKDGVVLFRGKQIAGSVTPLGLYHRSIHRLALEKPALHLSLQDLFRPSAKPAPQFTIGELKIDDGEMVLETGQRAPLVLGAVFLSADHVNLGAETGLQLKANLPALDASAVVSLTGATAAKRAEIVVYQAKEKKVFAAELLMTAKAGNAYDITGSGEATGLSWGAETIDGEFHSALRIGAKFETVRWSVELKTPRFPMKIFSPATALDPGAVAATAAGDYSAAHKTIKLEKINAASAIGALSGQGSVVLTDAPARLAAALKLRDAPLDRFKPLMPAALGALSYGGKLTADLSVSGPYNDPVVAGLAWNDGGKVEGERATARRLTFKFPFHWTDWTFTVKAGQVQAEDLVLGRKGQTQLRLQRATLLGGFLKPRQKPLEMSGDFQVFAGRFSTADESKIGENLNAKGRFACRECGGNASFTSEFRIESLELLWNKFFGDFKDRQPSIQANGTYLRAADELKFDRLLIALDSIGRLEVRGSVRRPLADPAFALQIQTDGLRAAGFYDFFIRDTFKAAYPILGQIGLGGKGALALRAEGSREAFTVEGKFRLDEGAIQEKSGRWRVGPIAMDVPLRLGYPAAAKESAGSGEPPVGKLSIDEIKTASTTIPKIATPTVLWNNSLRFPEPVRLSLFGGGGVIEGLAWKDVVSAPADLSFSLELRDLKLAELTETLGWHRFGGALSGKIPAVHWAGGALKSDGTIDLSLFGGGATIRGMEVEKPLSSARSIKMSVRLDTLDLEQASETFEFGRISGAISGTIDNLVMAQGQPSEFNAEIHTVDKPGVSQWISVDALNKITVVSSGNDAGSLYGGLAGFFDFFRYGKLGFKAALKNDRLTLRGIESKGGQEYLVVGSWIPPTVNIVSYTQEIAFSELVRRLERVKKRSAK